MSPPLRVVVAGAESAGHAFPEIALARELRARGHDVIVETSERWRDAVEALGLRLLAIEEAQGTPTDGPYSRRLAAAARALVPHLQELAPDLIVSDAVAAAPPLAAEAAGIASTTLIATLYPVQEGGLPLYPLGFVAPRTPLGSGAWRLGAPALGAVRPRTRWLRRVPAVLAEAREELGLAPVREPAEAITSYGAISSELAMVATFPQLEYPRRWPAHVHVTGPMIFEPPHPGVELPAGTGPLVLVASSTAQDPDRELIEIALESLAGEPVRIVATTNRPGDRWPGPVPERATVVDWISYARVMPRSSLVICRGGHGTVARALAEGVPVLVCPEAGDMPENGARVTWAGAGLMLPRPLFRPGPLRWAVRRMLADERFTARARELAAWARDNDGAARGAALVEGYARR